ncbi:hypothetical protein BDR26DRAFT_871143 [Obelidium mucronatum]|nr:hypothetical protein BDR26DRAFT_871143 [Obelidium mucronatum]
MDAPSEIESPLPLVKVKASSLREIPQPPKFGTKRDLNGENEDNQSFSVEGHFISPETLFDMEKPRTRSQSDMSQMKPETTTLAKERSKSSLPQLPSGLKKKARFQEEETDDDSNTIKTRPVTSNKTKRKDTQNDADDVDKVLSNPANQKLAAKSKVGDQPKLTGDAERVLSNPTSRPRTARIKSPIQDDTENSTIPKTTAIKSKVTDQPKAVKRQELPPKPVFKTSKQVVKPKEDLFLLEATSTETRLRDIQSAGSIERKKSVLLKTDRPQTSPTRRKSDHVARSAKTKLFPASLEDDSESYRGLDEAVDGLELPDEKLERLRRNFEKAQRAYENEMKARAIPFLTSIKAYPHGYQPDEAPPQSEQSNSKDKIQGRVPDAESAGKRETRNENPTTSEPLSKPTDRSSTPSAPKSNETPVKSRKSIYTGPLKYHFHLRKSRNPKLHTVTRQYHFTKNFETSKYKSPLKMPPPPSNNKNRQKLLVNETHQAITAPQNPLLRKPEFCAYTGYLNHFLAKREAVKRHELSENLMRLCKPREYGGGMEPPIIPRVYTEDWKPCSRASTRRPARNIHFMDHAHTMTITEIEEKGADVVSNQEKSKMQKSIDKPTPNNDKRNKQLTLSKPVPTKDSKEKAVQSSLPAETKKPSKAKTSQKVSLPRIASSKSVSKAPMNQPNQSKKVPEATNAKVKGDLFQKTTNRIATGRSSNSMAKIKSSDHEGKLPSYLIPANFRITHVPVVTMKPVIVVETTGQPAGTYADGLTTFISMGAEGKSNKTIKPTPLPKRTRK